MNSQSLYLTVKEVIQETDDTVSLVFELPDAPLDYEPGQFLTLVVQVNGELLHRAYSLATVPGVDVFPTITIKRVPGGRASNYLNDEISAGSVLEIQKPAGRFTLSYHPENHRHLIFIGGGSGITPLMSMLKAALHKEPSTVVSLLYSNRDQDSIIYKDELTQLENLYGDRLNVVHVLTRPLAGWEGYTGRITSEGLKEILNTLPSFDQNSIEYLVCGPEGLMNVALGTLEEMGVEGDRIHKESFYSSTENVAEEPIVEREIMIHFEGETTKVNVGPDETILDAGLDAGIDLPYSCSTGMCNVCVAKCVKGKVHMTEEEGLTDEEVEEGFILTCVAHPLTDDVELDVE